MNSCQARRIIYNFWILFGWIVKANAFEIPFAIEFDTILPEDIFKKIENIVYPICYMNCHEDSKCKSVMFEKYIDGHFGDCYLLNMYPLDCRENYGIFARPAYVGKKLTSGCCGDAQTDDCLGTKTNPARSCNDLWMSNSFLKSGYYWMDFCTPTLVYCDMETEGGGWLMIGSVVSTTKTNPSDYIGEKVASSEITELSKVQTERFLLSVNGLQKLQIYTEFSQIRIYCEKNNHNRTLHIMTSNDNHGSNVVDYLTLKSSENPQSCHSYVRAKDDTSSLGKDCKRWYNKKWSTKTTSKTPFRVIFDHLITVGGGPNINLIGGSRIRLECDDNFLYEGFTNFGSWKYFVR